MKYRINSSIINMFVILLAIGESNLHAQQAITSTGGNATGSGGSASYTVGQVSYTTVPGSSGTVSQGVQQPYEILIVTGLEDAKDISLEFTVYPNPTTDFLKLKIDNFKMENLAYRLYDNNGSLLQEKKIESQETIIQTGELVPAAYYLKICDSQKDIKIFKIIKN
jgi:hypothetical protein